MVSGKEGAFVVTGSGGFDERAGEAIAKSFVKTPGSQSQRKAKKAATELFDRVNIQGLGKAVRTSESRCV